MQNSYSSDNAQTVPVISFADFKDDDPASRALVAR